MFKCLIEFKDISLRYSVLDGVKKFFKWVNEYGQYHDTVVENKC